MTVFLVLCGLLLVLFVEPPNRPRPGRRGTFGNWRPALLVLGRFMGFIGMLAISPLRTLFNLQVLGLVAYLVIGGATLLWATLMWVIWRFHLFEHFFQLAGE